MIIELKEYDKQIIERTAKEFGVKADDLAQCYQDVMELNFEQDIWDIAKENLNELRKEL